MSGTMRGMYGSTHSDYYREWGGLKDAFGRKGVKGFLQGSEKRSGDSRPENSGPENSGPENSRPENSGSGNGMAAGNADSARPESGRTGGSASVLHTRESTRRSRGARGAGGAAGGTAAAAAVGTAAGVRPVEIVKGRRIDVDAPVLHLPSPGKLRRRITPGGILLALASLLVVSAALILMLFNFETAAIYGNTKYSQEQIESFITRGRLGDNTFVMALKYHNRKVEDIPFVDQIDIDIVNPSTVRVNIKEKKLDGCICYKKGQNVYISKDGVIETVSGRVAEEATQINGVVLTHAKTGLQVLAQNQLALDLSLEALRAMDKYGIHADEITADEKSCLTVSFGDIDVEIGKTGYDQKMYKLHQVLPYMQGRSGVISMTGFEEDYMHADIVLSPRREEDGQETEELEIDAWA